MHPRNDFVGFVSKKQHLLLVLLEEVKLIFLIIKVCDKRDVAYFFFANGRLKLKHALKNLNIFKIDFNCFFSLLY